MIHSTLTDLDKLSKCTEIYLLTIWHHLYLQHLKSRFRSTEPLLLLEAANHQMSARVSCIHKQFKTALQFVLKSHCTQSYSIGDSSNATCVFFITGDRLVSSPSSDNVLCGVLPKTERPKSLDLSGGQGSLRLAVPHLSSTRQHQLSADRLHGVEEEDTETDQEKPQVERSVSCSTGTVRRTGIETGFDPLSLLTTDTVQQCDQENSSTSTARRDLAEEIEMYMNNASSPLSSRAPSMDLQNPSSPLFRSASSPHTSPRPSALLRSNTHLPLPVKCKDRLRPSPSLPLGVCNRDRERPSSLVSPSSPTPSTSSFSMDSLFTPTLDIFKSSVISAGKGVAEKASRLYSRLSSQTSLTQVGSAAFSPI